MLASLVAGGCVSGSLGFSSTKTRVYKKRALWWCRNCQPEPTFEKPWVAHNGYGTHEEFETWREAYDFARGIRMWMT